MSVGGAARGLVSRDTPVRKRSFSLCGGRPTAMGEDLTEFGGVLRSWWSCLSLALMLGCVWLLVYGKSGEPPSMGAHCTLENASKREKIRNVILWPLNFIHSTQIPHQLKICAKCLTALDTTLSVPADSATPYSGFTSSTSRTQIDFLTGSATVVHVTYGHMASLSGTVRSESKLFAHFAQFFITDSRFINSHSTQYHYLVPNFLPFLPLPHIRPTFAPSKTQSQASRGTSRTLVPAPRPQVENFPRYLSSLFPFRFFHLQNTLIFKNGMWNFLHSPLGT